MHGNTSLCKCDLKLKVREKAGHSDETTWEFLLQDGDRKTNEWAGKCAPKLSKNRGKSLPLALSGVDALIQVDKQKNLDQKTHMIYFE